MSSLFRLPLEVRQMIYARCLVVGKVFPYTYAERYDEYEYDYDDEETGLELSGCEEPWVPLLRVSRAVREEAEPMLYQRNTFFLPACDLTIRFFKRSLHNDLRKAWVKSVVLALDASDMTRYDRGIVLDKHLELRRDEMLFPERAYDDAFWPEEESFKENLHLAFNDRLGDVVWPRKASYVLKNLSLNDVIFDFRGSACIEGCCDMQLKALSSIVKGFAMGRPMKVEVLGMEPWRQLWERVIAKWPAIQKSDDDDGCDYFEGLDILQT
ncbi:hypothetical protein N7G274_009734 [Stereocaulon virgatum]|uniref:Uncharacterized protein n=1 Tax=Stereocaulon virgatum TaxID=373712 RepID=A0ABR3ZV23_9LECA